jgi:hypothetical protein
MKWETDYLVSGIGILIAIILVYLSFPSFDPLLFVCFSLILIITGIFERMMYYNKLIYLILITVVLLVTLLMSFIITPPPVDLKTNLMYYIGTGIYMIFIVFLAYIFVQKFEKKQKQ